MSESENTGCAPKPPLVGDAVGKEVARDFGEEHGGIFYGTVTSVKGGEETLYRVRYTDGDEEDLDEGQYTCAYSLALAARVMVDARESPNSSDSSSVDEMQPKQSTKRRRQNAGVRKAQQPDAGVPGPKWYDVGGGRTKRFKPLVSRTKMDEQATKPKFRPPCRETGDISPEAFCRMFLSDELVQTIAKNSERYRKTCGVSVHFFF